MEKTIKTNQQKYRELTDVLPDFTQSYFYSELKDKAMLTRLAYARDAKVFLEYACNQFTYLKGKSPKDITVDDFGKIGTEDINDFLSALNDKGLSINSLIRMKSSLSQLFSYLCNMEKKLTSNPVNGSVLKINKEKNTDRLNTVKYLTMNEQSVLINGIRTGEGLSEHHLKYHAKTGLRNLAIISLFLDTGIKLSELQTLDIKDVINNVDEKDPERKDCHLLIMRKNSSKKSVPTEIYFSDETGEYLRDYLNERKITVGYMEEDPLFISRTGSRLSVREIQAMVKKYVKDILGREDISVNDLRSSFAVEYYRAYKNINLMMQRMGLTSLTMANMYVKASDEDADIRNTRNWRK